MNRGLLAEFADPTALVAAARRAREDGYTRLDAYAPQPVEGLDDALALPRSPLPRLVLAAGVLGGAGGFLLQAWTATRAYPMNVGGRADFSWPAFVVPAFETAILGAALAAVLGMLALAGLPRPHHPLFDVDAFARASRDRYFLGVAASDPRFDAERTRRFLRELGAEGVHDVAD